MSTAQQSPELSELLCFDLYAASRAVTAVYRPLLSELGLTYPQYLVLVVLWREGTCTIKQLGEWLQLDYGTLTPLLQRLAANGLVTRERRRDDERSVAVGLTTMGTGMQHRARHIPANIQAATGLDSDQTAALHVTLQALTVSVVASSGERTGRL